MTIRTRLLILSIFVALSIGGISFLFSSALNSVEKIDQEKAYLVTLADSVRGLSVAVNSLDSNQFDGVQRKFRAAIDASNKAFDDLKLVTLLPTLNAELEKAYEIMGNMRALITDDLKSLEDQFTALQPDLQKYFLESNSTTIRMFYTDDRIRSQYDLHEVFARIDSLITLINGLTETLAGVTDTIQSEQGVINDETVKVAEQSIFAAIVVSGVILVVIILVSFLIGTSISRRVKEMQRLLVPVSNGDFSQYLPVRGSDEVAGITKTVNLLLDALNNLLGEVKTQVDSLSEMGSNLNSKMLETSNAVEHIQGNLENSNSELAAQNRAVDVSVDSALHLETFTEKLSQDFKSQMEILSSSSAGVEQIIANIGAVNANIDNADNSSKILQQVSREGQVKLDLVAQSVLEISRSSENLVAVTNIINDVADKTNLLAMNASIEAAHAGDFGRGFGVVANEIRKLAEQAASQSNEISKDLSNVNRNIAAIQAATTTAVEVFQKIVAQTSQVSSIVQEVQTSMNEQNRGGSLVLQGIQQLNEITAQVSNAVEEMKQGEAAILSSIRELAKQNSRVNENNEAVSVKTQEIAEIVRQTKTYADSTRQQIESLETETSKFKTRSVSENAVEAQLGPLDNVPPQMERDQNLSTPINSN